MRRRWNHESSKEEAKKYRKLGQWERLSHGSYVYAKKHGLVKEYSMHMQVQFFWTYDSVKKDALNFKSKREWFEKSIGSYQYAVRNKLLSEFTGHMVNPRIKWTYDSVKKESQKYRFVKEWLILSQGSYVFASRLGLLKELTLHMEDIRNFPEEQKRIQKLKKPIVPKYKKEKIQKIYKKNLWSHELVKEEALKHSSRSEWRGNSYSSFNYAKRRKTLFEECVKHMGEPLIGKTWTKKECIDSAKKYETKSEWRNGDSKTYSFARSHGWLSVCSKHMEKSTPPNFWKVESNLIKEMTKYSSRREFISHNGSAYQAALSYHIEALNKHFPIIEYATTSMGETTARAFLEKIFNCEFIKQRHDFLINPLTGNKLELDGYVPSLKLAFEYGNHKRLKSLVPEKELEKVLARDEFKKQKCEELGIKLMQLTDSMEYKNPAAHLKQQIKDELIRLGVKIPAKFNSTKITIIQAKGRHWNPETIWEAVKSTRNIYDLQLTHGGAYGVAVKLGIIDEIRKHYKTPYRRPKQKPVET